MEGEGGRRREGGKGGGGGEGGGGGGRHVGSFERYVEEMREGGVIRGRGGGREREGKGKREGKGGDIYIYARFQSYFESVLKKKMKGSFLVGGEEKGRGRGGEEGKGGEEEEGGVGGDG